MQIRKHKKLQIKYERHTMFFLITHLEFIFPLSHPMFVWLIFSWKQLLHLALFISTTTLLFLWSCTNAVALAQCVLPWPHHRN